MKKKSEQIYFSFIFILYKFFFIINNQGKQRKMLKLTFSLLFVSGSKAILLYERCVCFGTDCKRKDRVRRSFFSDEILSKH